MKYFEGTVTPDMDGKMKDIVEEIDEIDHLDLKEIADEAKDLMIKKHPAAWLTCWESRRIRTADESVSIKVKKLI
jgi:hypothetical protein